MATTGNKTKTRTGARSAVEEVAPGPEQQPRHEAAVKRPDDTQPEGVGQITHPTPPPPNVDEPLADEASAQPEAGEGPTGEELSVTTSDDGEADDEGEEPIAFDIRPDFEGMDKERFLT